ncbi:ankyrin repeat-containing domain protein [Xylariomycetidae sp. FL0641]|nr:ankyrin repeat-containing domain protein [Xylariomycetidae sp. FL0641]
MSRDKTRNDASYLAGCTPLHMAAYRDWHEQLKKFCDDPTTQPDDRNENGETALHLASLQGHVEISRILLEKNVAVDAQNNDGETALMWAAKGERKSRHLSLVKLLMAHGASFETAFQWAVIRGHDQEASLLLYGLFNTDARAEQKNKALLLAAEAGRTDTLKLLLDNGADIDWVDWAGSTALTWALPSGHESAAKLLLDHHADVNISDIYHNPPLHWALPYPHLTRLVLEHGAKVNAQNDDKQTALMWAAQAGRLDTLRLLLDHNADVNLQDKLGFTALHAAALKGYEEVARLLLRKGANPNLGDQDGWTPLHAAVLRRHENIADLLQGHVTHGKDIRTRMEARRNDKYERAILEELAERKAVGSTVVLDLRAAVNDNNISKVRNFLETGVDINVVDDGGSTALTWAVSLRREAIVELLLEHGADTNIPEASGRMPLHLAIDWMADNRMIRTLVDHGADIEAQIHMWTPLLMACKVGRGPLAQFLVKKGANTNAEDHHGRRPLHWITMYGNRRAAEVLVKYGADVNARDREGKTALMWATELQTPSMAKYLLSVGADVTTAALDGTTALHMAICSRKRAIVNLLLQAGARPDQEAADGTTPLQLAEELNDEVAQVIIKEALRRDKRSNEQDDASSASSVEDAMDTPEGYLVSNYFPGYEDEYHDGDYEYDDDEGLDVLDRSQSLGEQNSEDDASRALSDLIPVARNPFEVLQDF